MKNCFTNFCSFFSKFFLIRHEINNQNYISFIAQRQMKGYFYNAPKLTRKWLESQYNMARREDQIFRDAVLAALKLDPSISKNLQKANNLRETILNLTIEQQFKYANNVHLQSLFNHFYLLHRSSRGRGMIVHGQQATTTELVDPDKFPIWDLKPAKNMFYSTWSTVLGKLRFGLGHQLIVRESLVEHPEGGKGVFVVLPQGSTAIEAGQFLGLVPGTIYDSYSNYEEIKLKRLSTYQRVPNHLHFPSGKILQLGDIKYNRNFDEGKKEKKQYFIEASNKNPYALGHMINHPPTEAKPNVVFSEIQLPEKFLPNFLFKKYMPYDYQLPISVKKSKSLSVFGIFASKSIKNGQQLYVDYCQNHIYPIEEIPDWLFEPQEGQTCIETGEEVVLGLKKGQYENPSPSYWGWLERKALQKNQHLYQKYRNQIRKRPADTIYQNQKVKIRQMKSPEQNI